MLRPGAAASWPIGSDFTASSRAGSARHMNPLGVEPGREIDDLCLADRFGTKHPHGARHIIIEETILERKQPRRHPLSCHILSLLPP
ncbi:hypothetical protein RCH07_003281 [Arthrobacter sp. CG_A4]|nr:hypothetical protein [Arthrobacter sp. CG_A4]